MLDTARRINRAVVHERARLIRARRRRERRDGAGPVGEGKGGDSEAAGEDDDEVGTRAEREWGTRRIVLAGFSQGAVMSLLVGLTHPERLGGVIVFSGFLPLRDEMAKVRRLPRARLSLLALSGSLCASLSQLMYDLDRRDLPVWWGHGGQDEYLTCVLSPSRPSQTRRPRYLSRRPA